MTEISDKRLLNAHFRGAAQKLLYLLSLIVGYNTRQHRDGHGSALCKGNDGSWVGNKYFQRNVNVVRLEFRQIHG